MLLKDYRLELVLPECNPSSLTVNAVAELDEDIGEVLPYLNASLGGCRFYPEGNFLRSSYKKGDEAKPLQVYNLLPRTNCKKCGEPSCFAFAARLVKQEAELAACTPLAEPAGQENRHKLAALLGLA
ncbi:MAG: (Fe-S)-binding protein [Desulfotomaculales bacterium]